MFNTRRGGIESSTYGPRGSAVQVAVFVHDISDNAVGRAYVHWLLCHELGWGCKVIAPMEKPLWRPLQGTHFSHDCVSHYSNEQTIEDADILIALKTWPGSFGRGIQASKQHRKPLALDVDDPDYEANLGELATPRRKARFLRSLRGRGVSPLTLKRLRRAARRYPVMVSNPELQRWYGGAVIPHVRHVSDRFPCEEQGAPGNSKELVVAFVGTPHRVKGIEILRTAVDKVPSTRLIVTGRSPSDARPWEDWKGSTSLLQGSSILQRAHALIAPSLAEGYPLAQFPVKLLDAFSVGCPVVATRVGAIPWVARGAGILVEPNRSSAIVGALESLREGETRRWLGKAGRTRLMEHFSPEAVAPSYALFLQRATETGSRL